MGTPSREPGWYPDRNDHHFERYWNGRDWTTRRESSQTDEKPKRRVPIWLVIVCVMMMVRAVSGVVSSFDPAGSHSATPTSPPASSTPSQSASH